MKKSESKIMCFLRRNLLYLVLATCVLAIGLSVTLVLVNKGKNTLSNEIQTVTEIPNDTANTDTEPTETVDEPSENPEQPVSKTKTFVMPVVAVDRISEYSENMTYNATMKRFSSHKAVDFFAEEGTPVYAIADGTVERVETTLIYGTTIVINHGDGLLSVYNSLSDGELVSVGQKVKQGDKIGEVSTTNRQEHKEGSHLHFEMSENGVTIDPNKYLDFDLK